jgi:hypothetical protein
MQSRISGKLFSVRLVRHILLEHREDVVLDRLQHARIAYREKGPKGFYTPRVTRGPAVLVDAVVVQAEERLAEGARRDRTLLR